MFPSVGAHAQPATAEQKGYDLARKLKDIEPVFNAWVDCASAGLRKFVIQPEPMNVVVGAAMASCQAEEDAYQLKLEGAYLEDFGSKFAREKSLEISSDMHKRISDAILLHGIKFRAGRLEASPVKKP